MAKYNQNKIFWNLKPGNWCRYLKNLVKMYGHTWIRNMAIWHKLVRSLSNPPPPLHQFSFHSFIPLWQYIWTSDWVQRWWEWMKDWKERKEREGSFCASSKPTLWPYDLYRNRHNFSHLTHPLLCSNCTPKVFFQWSLAEATLKHSCKSVHLPGLLCLIVISIHLAFQHWWLINRL